MISGAIAMAKKYDAEMGESVVLDPDFASDVEEIAGNSPKSPAPQ